jgi:uncharacterized protein (TIGR02246 family)
MSHRAPSMSLAQLLVATCILVPRFATAQPAEKTTDPQAKEKAAIRQAAEKYLEAVRKGDARQVAASWTENGVFVDADGHSAKGRDLARDIRARDAEQELGSELPAVDSDIRIVTSDVAVEDGVLPGSDDRECSGHFTAVWVKQDGAWLLDSVRESHVPKIGPHDRLRPLAWLVGQWRTDDEGHQVEVSCDWSPDGNFLIREIRVRPTDGPSLAIHQRIGWDGARRQIRSWTFDSAGGHGDGVWTAEGKQWLVTTTAVNPAGHEAAGRNTYTLEDDGSLVWESTQAAVAGNVAPDQKLRFVRVPAGE